MNEFLRQLISGIAQTWRRLSISARVQLGIAALLTIGLVTAAAYFGGQPQYGQLYQRLAPDDANAVTVWLTDQSIPYKLRQGGTAIDVPVRDITRARMGLAAQNLPKSQGAVVGFEVFDKRDLMSNKYLQDVDYMRALRGELQRQLNQFDFVRNSYVFIREAPDSLFLGEQKPSEASVTLQTNGPVTPEQVKAVLHTVSSFGGANLSEKNISVVTTDGTILHGASEDAFASLASDKLGVQVAYEQQAEKKLNDAFRKAGKSAVVKVSALLDWTSEEVKDKKMAEGVDISSSNTTDTTREVQAQPEGPPGATSNIPEELGGRQSDKGIITSSIENITNSEPSETVRTTSTPPGRLKKYTVAAFIDPGYDPVVQNGQPVLDANGKPQMQPKQMTPAEVQNYRSFIGNAIGVGDTVETDVVVIPQPLNIEQLAMAAPVTATGVPWMESPWFGWVWRIGLVLGFFIAIRILMRRALVLPATEEEEVIEIPEASPAERRAQEIAAEVERLSQQEPDTVAALLRTWMNQE